MKNKSLFLGFVSIMVLTMFISTVENVFAQSLYGSITGGTMKVGSRGENVTSLQTFLASNHDIYPRGLITGYYGLLTQEAVKQFQLAYDIQVDGTVGPITAEKINGLIAQGRGMDVYAPTIVNPTVNVSGKEVKISFSSNEAVRADIFYDSAQLSYRDTGLAFSQPIISGTKISDPVFNNSKQITLSNLMANTGYNYMIVVTDASGNVSVTLPRTFTTGS